MRIGLDLLAVRHGIGCGQVYPVQLVHALAKVDTTNEYVLFVSQGNVDLFEGIDNRMSLEVCRFDNQRVPLRVFYENTILPMKCFGLDVLHCTGNFAPVVSPVPTVVSLHFLTSFTARQLFAARNVWALNFLVRRTARTARRMMMCSETLREEAIRVLGIDPARAVVVPYGLSSVFHPPSTIEDHASLSPNVALPEKPFFLIVTDSLPHKNNRCALQALHIASRRLGRRLSFVVVGPAELRDEFAAPVDDSTDEQSLVDITYTGVIPQEVLAELYRQAAALVIPSFVESFGLPVLEALACGTVVICSDLPAFREICDDVPLYCDAGDAESFADALCAVVSGDARAEAREGQGLRIASRFTWEETARRTIEVYAAAAGGR